MSRPRKNRRVSRPPRFAQFKPLGAPAKQLEEIRLSLDEYEAIRLADGEAHDQTSAAEKMGISRPTFTRLIESARKKTADFLEKGALLTIEGGSVHFLRDKWLCRACGKTFDAAFDKHPAACPECEGTDIISLAETYGHGSCCREELSKSK